MRLHRLREASGLIGLSVQTLRKEIHCGRLGAVRVGNLLLLRESDLRAFIRSRRVSMEAA